MKVDLTRLKNRTGDVRVVSDIINRFPKRGTFFTALFMLSFCEIPTVKVTRYFGLNGRSWHSNIQYQLETKM
jgi:hypothetical protein